METILPHREQEAEYPLRKNNEMLVPNLHHNNMASARFQQDGGLFHRLTCTTTSEPKEIMYWTIMVLTT